MTAANAAAPKARPIPFIVMFGLFAAVLALRLAHFSSAIVNPLTYQPGPDEDYYQRFGQAVATGHGENSGEFTFMDPAYGFLIGAIFRLVGVNPIAVFLLQALLDTATAYGILLIGRWLGRERAGLYGALLYGLTATALLFTTTMLKETWVASLLTWWMACALAAIQSRRNGAWLLFGVVTGSGIALRSTLLLLALAALALPWLRASEDKVRGSHRLRATAFVAGGIAVALLPFSIRNLAADGELSPLPHNGGIVLHQVYNPENPDATLSIPGFVNYRHPSEIWRAYEAEALRRSGHALKPQQVDRYWRTQALEFIGQHPLEVVRDVLRKSLTWLSATEVPENRSIAEEKLFSPVLRLLPAPAAWLLGLGLAGLVWLAREDRRWPVVAAPILLSFLTAAVFLAETRFRFHAAPALALCAGIWVDRMQSSWTEAHKRPALVFAAAAAMIVAASLGLASRDPPVMVHWDRIVWGYIRMHRITEAQTLAERITREEPDNGAVFEALGYIAVTRAQYAEAASALRRAIALRPRSHVAHYNLARALRAMGDRAGAAGEARLAADLQPSAENLALLQELEAGR